MPRKGAVLIRAQEVERLREKAGISQEILARQADVDVRTYRRWLNGDPAFIKNVVALAHALGLRDHNCLIQESPPVVIKVEEDGEGFALKMTLELAVTGGRESQSPRLAEIVAFLSKFLPDGKGLCIIGSTMGTAIISINKTSANEAALADPGLKQRLNTLGVRSFSISEYVRIIGRATPPAPKTNKVSSEYETRCSEAAWKRVALREELEQKLLTSEEFSKAMQALKSEYADCWDDS